MSLLRLAVLGDFLFAQTGGQPLYQLQHAQRLATSLPDDHTEPSGL